MEQIFLNFRTGDQDMAAPFLYDYLTDRFGTGTVFFSSHSITGGAHFPDELVHHAQECQVLLALIGPRWLTMTGPGERSLLADPDDWVRREIATALAAGRTVIPILVANAPRLAPEDLPADLAPLAEAEYRYLRRRDLNADLHALQRDLVHLIPRLRIRSGDGSGSNVGLQVDENIGGTVIGIRVGKLRSQGGDLQHLLGSPSVHVARNENGRVIASDVEEWDRLEEWGNEGADHPPLPELPA
jgi:hypothetical protein